MFFQFFRGKEAQKVYTGGAGLGLALAKQLLTSAKGKIWFESEQGKGTTFFVELPKK